MCEQKMKNNKKNNSSVISFFHNLLKHHLKCLSMEYDMSPEGKIEKFPWPKIKEKVGRI